jgi:hypothetical protein
MSLNEELILTPTEVNPKLMGGVSMRRVGQIPGVPFETFGELQAAVAGRTFNIGVDPLAAAEWSESFSTRSKRIIVTILSCLLISAAVTSVVVAIAIQNYWLLAALPVQAVAFYVSHPESPIRQWVTVAGVASVIVFANLLLNHLTTAAALTAYAGLTFAAVRAAAFTVNSGFRKALLSDEALFLAAYAEGACTLRQKSTGSVYRMPH